MFMVIGLRSLAARLGTAFLLCPYCQTPAAQAVNRVRRWVTLFFIPVLPIGAKYTITCTMCGRATQVAKETADAYAAPTSASASTTPPPAPAPPPPNLLAAPDVDRSEGT